MCIALWHHQRRIQPLFYLLCCCRGTLLPGPAKQTKGKECGRWVTSLPLTLTPTLFALIFQTRDDFLAHIFPFVRGITTWVYSSVTCSCCFCPWRWASGAAGNGGSSAPHTLHDHHLWSLFNLSYLYSFLKRIFYFEIIIGNCRNSTTKSSEYHLHSPPMVTRSIAVA